jgi:Domain of unknown function (DUF4253)
MAGSPHDVVAVSAVLRSWEDRFGATLVGLGHASLELSVAAPPWEPTECLAIAAEHYAFCDDTYRGNPAARERTSRTVPGSSVEHTATRISLGEHRRGVAAVQLGKRRRRIPARSERIQRMAQ